jgi:Resolvase, N terminal domain
VQRCVEPESPRVTTSRRPHGRAGGLEPTAYRNAFQRETLSHLEAGELQTPVISKGPSCGHVAWENLTGVVCQRHRRWMNELLVGYPRVSTEQRDVTAQRNGLHALGVGDDRIYVDHGLTGTNRNRPGLRLALAACRAGTRWW